MDFQWPGYLVDFPAILTVDLPSENVEHCSLLGCSIGHFLAGPAPAATDCQAARVPHTGSMVPGLIVYFEVRKGQGILSNWEGVPLKNSAALDHVRPAPTWCERNASCHKKLLPNDPWVCLGMCQAGRYTANPECCKESMALWEMYLLQPFNKNSSTISEPLIEHHWPELTMIDHSGPFIKHRKPDTGSWNTALYCPSRLFLEMWPYCPCTVTCYCSAIHLCFTQNSCQQEGAFMACHRLNTSIVKAKLDIFWSPQLQTTHHGANSCMNCLPPRQRIFPHHAC